MAGYRTKTVDLEVMQFTGDNINEIWDWAGADNIYGPVEDDPNAYIIMPKTRVAVHPGVYIIKVGSGYFFPYRSELFTATHGPIEDQK